LIVKGHAASDCESRRRGGGAGLETAKKVLGSLGRVAIQKGSFGKKGRKIKKKNRVPRGEKGAKILGKPSAVGYTPYSLSKA